MVLHDEIYFEITLEGEKEELERFASYATSGVFDDFFDVTDDYIIYDDNHQSAPDGEKLTMIFTNDEYGIEINRLDPEDFLDVLCKGATKLYVSGCIYDIDDEEYRFISAEGDHSFTNARHAKFNDELDEVADSEDFDDEEEFDS